MALKRFQLWKKGGIASDLFRKFICLPLGNSAPEIPMKALPRDTKNWYLPGLPIWYGRSMKDWQ
jgi:hypothetical protein